jgi:putative peptide zinc metalloprotease protein
LGHIVAAKKYKLKIKEIGIGVYSIFPVLYVDLNNIWSLSKEQRVIINLGGIYFQSIFGILLIILFNIFNYEIFLDLFLLNFTVLIINSIPVFKFDGYWLVSDLFEILNLSKKSNETIKSILSLDYRSLKKRTTFVLIYSISRLLFYSYISFILFKTFYYLYANFSIDLILTIIKSAYFTTLILLLTLKFTLNYGKRFFKKEKRII